MRNLLFSSPAGPPASGSRSPGVSVLVNNAGIQLNTPVASASAGDIEREIQVNFLAPVLLSRAFLPRLLNQPSAAIINVASGLALVPKEAAARLAEEFRKGFKADRHEMLIGKAKLLSVVNRLAPSVAEKTMRRGL